MTLSPEQVAAVGAILTAVVVAGLAKKWVFGWTYQEMVVDRNFWRDVALKGMTVTGKAVEIVEKRAEGG